MKTKIEQTILENGLRVVTGVFPNEEIVSCNLLVEAGARYETVGELGWAHLLEHMLLKGTEGHPSDKAIYEVIDQAGAYFNAFTNIESVRIIFQVHKKEWEKLFGLASEMLLTPKIDNQTLENEKKVIYEEIERSKNQYQRQIFWEVRRQAFPNSLIANDVLGTRESLAAATAEKLHEYHHQWFIPERTVLVFTGGKEVETIHDKAKQVFGDWNRGEKLRPVDGDLILSSGKVKLKLPTHTPQIQLNYFHPSLTLKEGIAYSVINNFLGYGFGSHLKTKLRHEKGLVYGISVHDIIYRELGVVQIATESTHPDQVIDLIRGELKNLAKFVTPKVIDRYKQRQANVWLRSMSEPGYVNGLIMNNLVYHGQLVTPEEIMKMLSGVDSEQIQTLVEKIFDEKHLWIGTATKE